MPRHRGRCPTTSAQTTSRWAFARWTAEEIDEGVDLDTRMSPNGGTTIDNCGGVVNPSAARPPCAAPDGLCRASASDYLSPESPSEPPPEPLVNRTSGAKAPLVATSAGSTCDAGSPAPAVCHRRRWPTLDARPAPWSRAAMCRCSHRISRHLVAGALDGGRALRLADFRSFYISKGLLMAASAEGSPRPKS
jgi:hypothetical protein